MKSEKKNTGTPPDDAQTLPIERFALLVEGLDADAIESACVADGAAPGGVPPAWLAPATPRARAAGDSRLSAERAAWEGHSADARRPVNEWDFVSGESSRIVALGDGANPAEAGEGDFFVIDDSVPPRDGDTVIADLPRFGRLLRELRFVGGAALLCSLSPGRLAIPLNGSDFSTLRLARRTDSKD